MTVLTRDQGSSGIHRADMVATWRIYPYQQAVQAVQDAIDRVTQQPTGVHNIHTRPAGTSAERAIRKLRKAANGTTGEVRGIGERDEIAKFAISSQVDRASQSGISHYTQRKLDYLARYAPDLLDAVRDGTRSTDAAYREARGKPKMIHISLDVKSIARACRHLTADEITELIAILRGHDTTR